MRTNPRKRCIWLATAALATCLGLGCGGGGDDPPAGQNQPGAGSNWDQMNWDQGTWG